MKLLDFGIAKVMKTEATATTLWMTAEGLRPMTPEYASPEQIREEPVSPATDVYSLGVVLYELLTGHRPYRLKSRLFHEILRVICEEEPTLPSLVVEFPPDAPVTAAHATTDATVRLRQTTSDGLRQALRGNLDNILIRALEKQPRKRYATAEQLEEDVARHLKGELVQAGSVRYSRMSRALSRHRGWVATGLFIVVAMAGGGISISWPTVWAASAALMALLAWRIVTDRDLARTVAAGPVWGILNVVMAVAFFTSVFVLDVVAGFLHGAGTGPARDFKTGEMKLVWCIPLTLAFARWLLRTRWGGGLVLNASRRRNGGFAIIAALAFIYIPLRLAGIVESHLPGEQEPAFALLFNTVDVLLWGFLYALSGRVEFRQHGIVTAAGFYRWTRIQSFEWRESTDEAVLQLNISGRHAALAPVRLRIPITRRSEAGAVMTRFLSEWPPLDSSKSRTADVNQTVEETQNPQCRS